jgi:predicted amidohydrolase
LVTRALGKAAALAWAAALVACGDGAEIPEPPPPTCVHAAEPGADVRVFVVGHRHAVSDGTSYASYEASYRRHMRDVAPCLAPDRPNLVVFPEGAGLVALAIGKRGDAARKEKESIQAFLKIAEAYAGAGAYYERAFPGISFARKILLALSDVVWRASVRTFGGIARDHGVWVLTNVDVGEVEPTTDPALVALLGDPEIDPAAGAFVATSARVLNSSLLFDPTGALAGRSDKIYLTDPEEDLLDLANGDFASLPLFETPFARIAAPISRDAFYPPYMQRMEDLGADLVVQPEAFGGWGVAQMEGDWLPDVFTSSTWLHTQKYTGLRYSLVPQLTGNFLDMPFDGQASIAMPARVGAPELGYVGQEPMAGWLAIGPWAIDDPGRADATLSIAERRKRLRAHGEALLPGSGSVHENAYAESLLAADLRIAPGAAVPFARDGARPESRRVAPSGREQRHPTLVADAAGRALLAWQEEREGVERILVATSADGGKGWSVPALVSGVAKRPERRPAACVAADGRVAIAWQAGEAGSERVRVTTLDAMGAAPAPATAVDAGDGPQWEPSCGFVGAAGQELVVAWTDVRTGVPRVRFARRAANAGPFERSLEIDPATARLPRLDGSQLQPALSPSGGHVAWIDYRDRSWDVYYARWDGAAFGRPQRIDAVGGAAERLHGEPRIAGAAERVAVVYGDLHGRRGHSDVGFALSEDSGKSWSKHAALPGGVDALGERSAGGGAMARAHPAIAADASRVVIALQDLAPGKSSVAVAWMEGLGAAGGPGAPERVDDTGPAPVTLRRPAVALTSRGALVAWEDDRDGPLGVFVTEVTR